MTETVPSAEKHTDTEPAAGSRRSRSRSRGRRVALAAAAGLVIAAAGIAFAAPDDRSPHQNANRYPTALASVSSGPLSAQMQLNARLGYAGRSTIVGQGGGTVTALPAVGQVIEHGQVIYQVNGSPVVLLYGTTPAYRSLAAGTGSATVSGPDVQQLNADLIALGLATRTQLDPASSTFGPATKAAVQRLQARLGLDQTGSLDAAQVVFEPGSIRVTSVSATLGAPLQPGSPVAQATSTDRQVVVDLDAARQADVKAADKVAITLPDGRTASGVVTRVGTVATTPQSSGGAAEKGGPASAGSSTPTVEVDIAPDDPNGIGAFDQAPVRVTVTTSTVPDALAVPVTALLSQPGDQYVVETVVDGAHRLVPVELGLFDDARELVQVTGSGLSAGQQVVVPAS